MNMDAVGSGINPSYLSGYKPNMESSSDVVRQEHVQQNVELLGANAAQELAEKNAEKEVDVNDAVDQLNETARVFNRSIRFKVHEDTHRTMISVVDSLTDKVIREIPSEEALDMVARMNDAIGALFDKRA